MKGITLVVCSVIIGLADACCPSFWTQYDKSCYRFVSQDKYWQEADAECVKLSPNARLVSIRSKNENSFVHALFREQGGTAHNAYWIGATDQYSEGSWEWSDGSPFDFSFWRSGQPSGGSEDCVEVYESDAGWNDLKCNSGRPYVCEMALP